MVVIRILNWNAEAAWTHLNSCHPKDLQRRLTRYTSLNHLEIKRLIRRLKERQCIAIMLSDEADRFDAHSLRQLFESLGANVEVDDTYNPDEHDSV